MDSTLLNAALVLIVSIAVLAIAALGVRRFITGRASVHGMPIRIIARQPLAQKASLVIAEIGDKRLLLGVTEHNVTLLGTLAQEAAQHAPQRTATPPNSVPITPPTAKPAELSFRAYLSSMFQRSSKGSQ